MKKRYAIILLYICSQLPTTSFAQDWQSYPYSPQGSVLTFPNDEGSHASSPGTTMEWWYINLHVIGSAPGYKEYDVMLCYFSTGNMRIFNISESSGTSHINVLQLYPTFVSQANKWDFNYSVPLQLNDSSHWTYPATNKTFQYDFHAEEPTKNDLLDITVTSNRAPLIVGGNGFIPLGNEGDSSFYYSLTNMGVTGKIKYNGVSDSITSGIAWIDRQWGPFTVGINPNDKYEWFSLQMDKPNIVLGTPQTPSEFNIWQIYSDSTSIPYQPEWRTVTGMYPDNTQDTSCTFFFERTGYWYDSTDNIYYSHGWRYIESKHGVTIDMSPKIDNQIINVTLFKFWEGSTTLKGTVNNLPVNGVGYAELVASYNSQVMLPSVPSGLAATHHSDHFSLSWEASTAGTYPVGGYRIFRNATNNGYWNYIATTNNLNYDDYTITADSSYYYTVTSFDNQTATSASDYANPVLALPTGLDPLSDNIDFFKIYPNPTGGTFKIEIANANRQITNREIEIYNTFGEKMYSTPMNSNSTVIDFKAPDGVYFLQLKTSEATDMRKIVITH